MADRKNKKSIWLGGSIAAGALFIGLSFFSDEETSGMKAKGSSQNPPVLQTSTLKKVEGDHYLPVDLDSIQWGSLPNKDSLPVMSIESGSTVTIDTISHEGILEDQGRNPVEYFKKFGVKEKDVLTDAIEIAESDMKHDFDNHGPHIVTGPIAVKGAEPGDVLKVEVLSLTPRVPYGIVSNRHYKGALPGEFPENEGRQEGASPNQYELYNNVSTFTPIEVIDDKLYGTMAIANGDKVRFPVKPFMGLMGVAPDKDGFVSSVPPIETGGNIDINELGTGSTLYLPVQVKDALFYTGDPHFSQGDGEVALTAWEASLRGTFRLTVLKPDDPSYPRNKTVTQPFAETEDHWIAIGLDEDLDEAMKESVRESISFLNEKMGMDRATALAYLSAATDYEVSQVVDKTKGIHALIDKKHFMHNMKVSVSVNGTPIKTTVMSENSYISLEELVDGLGASYKKSTKKGTATVKIGTKKISFQAKSNLYAINGKEVYHAGYPLIKGKDLYIPTKVAADIIGAKVNWTTSGDTLAAAISYPAKK